jgi:signal transduction histidine kinase
VLEITDDGVGFEPGPPRPGHYGIKSMRERASQLGAYFRIESARGQGTRIVTVVQNHTGVAGEQDSLTC